MANKLGNFYQYLTQSYLKSKESLYQHYKGGLYQVLLVATHTETEESMTVYKSLRDGKLWTRPSVMFDGMVDTNGVTAKRFTKL